VEANVHYLNWDREERTRENPIGPAGEIHHKAQTGQDLPETYDFEEFDRLYREITDVEITSSGEATVEDLEKIWEGFNRTGFTEWEEFLEMRYCDNCDSYIEGSDEALTHASRNHGYDSFEETGEPEYIRGIRSMTAGDIIEVDDQYFQARAIGFEEINVGGESQ